MKTGLILFLLLWGLVARAGCPDLLLEPINQRVQKAMEREFRLAEVHFEKKFAKGMAAAHKEFSGELVEKGWDKKLKNNPVLTEILGESLRALDRMSLLRESLKRVSPEEKPYFLEIYQASWSALVKHLDVYSHGALKKLDVPRFLKILRDISAFDESQAEFSFYKIKRSIEERYALREFLYCQ